MKTMTGGRSVLSIIHHPDFISKPMSRCNAAPPLRAPSPFQGEGQGEVARLPLPRYMYNDMHITMVKKKMKDGSDCRKCAEVTEHLQSRGLWDRIDEVVWAYKDDPNSPGMLLGKRLGVERAPFFVV